MNERIIAVVGATGAQGGGLIRAILNSPEAGFKPRAITRNPESDKARALAELGVEVVQADLDDRGSLEKAFGGAYGAFCVTNYWEYFSPERELAQATNMAHACKAAGVKHVIWSSLDDTRRWVPLDDDRMPTLQGKYKVPHFDAKGEADLVFKNLGLPVTILLTVFYWENFLYFGLGPQPGPDGKLALTFPLGQSKLPGIAAEDIGKCALGVFKEGGEYIGRTIGISGGHHSGAEMAEGFAGILGKEVGYNDVPPEVYRSFGFPGADDMGNMFQFKRDFESDYRASRSIEQARKLNPGMTTFDQWLKENAAKVQG